MKTFSINSQMALVGKNSNLSQLNSPLKVFSPSSKISTMDSPISKSLPRKLHTNTLSPKMGSQMMMEQRIRSKKHNSNTLSRSRMMLSDIDWDDLSF